MDFRSTRILKIAIICIGIPILIFSIILLPKIAFNALNQFGPSSTPVYVIWSILLLIYLSAIPFYLALYKAYKLLSYIENNMAFSTASVQGLRIIRNSSMSISIIYMLALPLIYIAQDWYESKDLLLIGMVVAGAAFVVAVFAAVLKKVLQEAIAIKSENDLTV